MNNANVEIVQEGIELGGAAAAERDYAWFYDAFLPAMSDPSVLAGRSLLASAWATVGDVYDMLEAPLAALEAYRRSDQLEPSVYVFQEISRCLHGVGDINRALAAIDQALALAPNDQALHDQIEFIKRTEDQPPLYEDSSLVWKCDEFMAARDFEAARLAVASPVDANEYLALGRVLGVTGDDEGVRHVWDQIEKLDGSIEMSYRDWFYLADSVWESTWFWDALSATLPRIEGVFESLPDEVFESLSDESRASYQWRMGLVVRFHEARTSGDREGLEALAAEFPMWEAVTEALSA